jgi:hypothetical protein
LKSISILNLIIISLSFSDIPLGAHLFPFGGIFYQAAFYLSFILLLHYNYITGKFFLYRPSWPFTWIICFVSWTIITFFVNSVSISELQIHGQTSIFRFTSQLFVIIFGLVVSLAVAITYIRHGCIRKISNSFKITVWISVFVGLLQVGYFIFNISIFQFILNPIYFLLRQDFLPVEGGRVSALMPEPSLLGMLLCTSLPFLLVNASSKSFFYKSIKILLVAVVIIGSNSRTFWLALFVQTIFYLVFFNRFSNQRTSRYTWIIYLFIFSLFVMSMYMIVPNFTYAINSLINPFDAENPFIESNVVRSISISSAIQLGVSNPILGVGLGGLPFHITEINELSGYYFENQNQLTATSLYARILAETGFTGLILWLFFWFAIIFNLVRNAHFLYKKNIQHDSYSFALAISAIGLLVSWFSNDSLSYVNQYLILGLSIGHLWKQEQILTMKKN